MTVNAALSHRRRNARHRKRASGASLDHLPQEAPGPLRQALAAEARAAVERAVTGLPEVYRGVFVLAVLEELPYAEVAQRVGVAVPTVKSRLHRARRLLRGALARHFR
jgi:RNA polymerase sigma-70 factor (ECF subfamily)